MTGRSRWATWAALFAYCFWSILLILPNPGLQYDEALLVLGAVQMRHSPKEIALPHDPHTWVCPQARCFPLMTMRYVGAIKEYACLPVFAIFGPSAQAVRLVSAMFGWIGIWGLARLLAFGVSPAAGAVAAWILAINPSYLDFTVFDNGTVAVWMAVFGLLSAAIAHYLRRPTSLAAFVVGICIGLGVWARANFLWLVLALLLASLLTWRTRLLRPVWHWAALGLGGLLGGAPFLAYQVVSRGGTWQAIEMFSSAARGPLYLRWVSFSEMLLSDREHRVMWNGPMLPDWQRWLFPAILFVACLVCIALRKQWATASVLTLFFLGGAYFFSRLPVAEHHLITLLPVAAAVVAIASERVRLRPFAPGLLAVVYAGCALFWLVSAIQGIRSTGGVGPWSNGIFVLRQVLEHRFPKQEIAILDWGLQNGLYVLSDGRIPSYEMYWGTGETPLFSEASWQQLIRQGGIFLINGPDNRMMPEATNGFLAELARARPFAEHTIVPQQSGVPYAEIVQVMPNTAGQAPEAAGRQLEGVYGLEQGQWRWTKRDFRVRLATPASAKRVQLVLNVYLPQATDTTLTAQLAGRRLCSQTFRQPGSYTFRCDVPDALLQPDGQWFDFSLDKTIAAAPPDTRELGLILSRAELIASEK